MKKELVNIFGKVKYELVGPNGLIKQKGEFHNIVVNEGDNWLIEVLSGTIGASMFASAFCHLGTGYSTGASVKTVDWLITSLADSSRPVYTGYPRFKATDYNVLQFYFEFGAGEFTSAGIDEAVIVSQRSIASGTKPFSSKILSFAEVTTAVNKDAADIFRLTWEITLLGS